MGIPLIIGLDFTGIGGRVKALRTIAKLNKVDDIAKTLSKIKGIPKGQINDMAKSLVNVNKVNEVKRVISKAITRESEKALLGAKVGRKVAPVEEIRKVPEEALPKKVEPPKVKRPPTKEKILGIEKPKKITRPEDVLLRERPKPNPLVFSKFEEYVKPGMIEREFKDLWQWTIDEKIKQTKEEVMKDLKLDMSCAAEEGKFLMSGETVLGPKFIFMPIERPEALDSLALLVPEIKERIVTTLNTYPARLSLKEKKKLGMK